jgi:hypothetical protein
MVDSFLVRSTSIELKESAMHDFLVGLVFVAVAIAPCVVALMTPLE